MIFTREEIIKAETKVFGGVNLILNSVMDNGLCIIKDYFTEEQAEALKKEQLDIYKNIPKFKRAIFSGGQDRLEEFTQGKAYAMYPDSYKQFPHMVRVMTDKVLATAVGTYYQGGQYFMQTFGTYENKVVSEDNLGRHSFLHVDPYAALKIAFFPMGATEENGALRVIPGSRAEGARIRINFMSKNPPGKGGGIAHTIEEFKEQCPELVTVDEKDAVYMECSPRDVCLIDTDTFHGGGLIKKKGQERLAVYIHSRP